MPNEIFSIRSFSNIKAVLTAFPLAMDQRDAPAASVPPTQPAAAATTNQGMDGCSTIKNDLALVEILVI
jgi:hypothetical protein